MRHCSKHSPATREEEFSHMQHGENAAEVPEVIMKFALLNALWQIFIQNENINATCNNFKDFTELQFI